jgi:hypothetical protein
MTDRRHRVVHVLLAAALAASLSQGCDDDEPPAGTLGGESAGSGQGGGTAAASVGAGGLYEEPGPVGSCSELCNEVTGRCSGDNAQYGSAAACEAVCATYPEGMADDMHGNTRGCRLSYAELASSDPATHCVHAGPVGTPAVNIGEMSYCGGACENFCALAAEVCSSTYASVSDCLIECDAFEFTEAYSPTAATGYSCRMAELTEAALDSARCANIVASSPTCT